MLEEQPFENKNNENQALARRRRSSSLLVIAGILVIASSLIWAFSGSLSMALAGGRASEADIVSGQPLLAQHEHSAGASDPASIPFLPKEGPQPRIYIEKNFYEFGKVGPAAVVTQEFFIFNKGDAPLTLSRAYTTCGCTTAEISARVIPPGKAAQVTLTFDAGFHDVRGQTVRRGLIIESNDPSSWQSEIWIQASVQNK